MQIQRRRPWGSIEALEVDALVYDTLGSYDVKTGELAESTRVFLSKLVDKLADKGILTRHDIKDLVGWRLGEMLEDGEDAG